MVHAVWRGLIVSYSFLVGFPRTSNQRCGACQFHASSCLYIKVRTSDGEDRMAAGIGIRGGVFASIVVLIIM